MKRLILILLLYSTYSYAVDFEFGLGSSWFRPNINGPVFNVSLRHQF